MLVSLNDVRWCFLVYHIPDVRKMIPIYLSLVVAKLRFLVQSSQKCAFLGVKKKVKTRCALCLCGLCSFRDRCIFATSSNGNKPQNQKPNDMTLEEYGDWIARNSFMSDCYEDEEPEEYNFEEWG